MGRWAFLRPRRDVFHSPHSAARCAQILNQDIDSRWKIYGHKPVFGDADSWGANLYKRIEGRNPLQTVVRLSFKDTASGCRIVARSSLPTTWLFYLLGWLLLSAVTFTSVYVVLPLLGIGVAILCRWLARNDFLLEYSRGRLDGQLEAPPTSSRPGGMVY